MVTASFNQKMRPFPEEIVNLMENGEITLLSPSSFTEPQWAWNRAGNKPSRNFSWLKALSYVRIYYDIMLNIGTSTHRSRSCEHRFLNPLVGNESSITLHKLFMQPRLQAQAPIWLGRKAMSFLAQFLLLPASGFRLTSLWLTSNTSGLLLP